MEKKKIIIIGMFLCIVSISALVGIYVKGNNFQKEACEIISEEGLETIIIKTGIIRNGDVCYVVHNGDYIEAVENIKYVDMLIALNKVGNPGVNKN